MPWTLPLPATSYQTGGNKQEPFDERSELGKDLMWNGGLVVDGSGDWVKISGARALRQSFLHRLVTSPGEWPVRPEYGIGANDFVYETLTPSREAELQGRIRAQLVQDPRVDRVLIAEVSRNEATGQLIILIEVEVKGVRVVLKPFLLPQESNP
jgi:phage baseplate assembly protein W